MVLDNGNSVLQYLVLAIAIWHLMSAGRTSIDIANYVGLPGIAK